MNENDAQAAHDRTREYAYEIWLAEGCPEGRADQHWELARMKVAMDDGQESMRRPARPSEPEPVKRHGIRGETLATQNDQETPHRTNARRTNGRDQHDAPAERETAWSRWREWMRGT